MLYFNKSVNDERRIIAATRFYPRKRDNVVSLYQFAIDKKYRGQNFLKKMLFVTGYKDFEVICLLDSSFNEHCKKTKWFLSKKDEKYNYWRMSLQKEILNR